MRSSAACLTLILFLSLVSVVGVKQSNAYTIDSHGIFRDVHQATKSCYAEWCECGSWAFCVSDPTHTFTLNDLRVYLVVNLTIEKTDLSGRTFQADWRDPTGNVIYRTPLHGALSWEWLFGYSHAVLGPYKIFDQLEVRYARPTRPSGLYTVTFYERNSRTGDKALFTEYFGIGEYPVFLSLEGLPQGQQVSYSVDGVESGRLEAGNVSVTSFPISETHTISTQKIVLSSNQEQFECVDCSHAVSEEATLSFHYSRGVSVATTMATSVTSQVTTASISTAIIPATVTVTAKESVPIDFAMLSIVMSVVAICVVAVLAFVVVRRRGSKA